MPARQPFTALCRLASRGPAAGRADLHLHTTHSDGLYTPAQVVELARRSGLSAVAVTDHDTLAGLPEAHAAAAGSAVEVVAGAEITCEYRGRELHLLAYFVRPDAPLVAALERLCRRRAERFDDMVKRLRACGVSLDEGDLSAGGPRLARPPPPRRVAGAGPARRLGARGIRPLPQGRRPGGGAQGAAAGGRGHRPGARAGGVAAWAHPSYDCTRETLAELRRLGLGAVEAEYPSTRPTRVRELRGLARELGLAVTGGSDCHGPDQPRRAVGACGISAEELDALRRGVV